jgi:ribulose-5-phosphate 4-epimerase/fuculose-1-phosphate aldolase
MSARKPRSLPPMPRLDCSESEWRMRVDLAACYRLAEIHRMAKVIWNHITARVPDEPDRILVLRIGCRFDEVTASNLVKMTLDGKMGPEEDGDRHNAAYVVHGGVYRARTDVMCVMHSHARGCQGVSALKEGLLPLTQEAMMFYDDIAYHDYEGIAEDESESGRMARDLGPMNQMILRNHGVITIGKTVGEAFWRMYHLEMACGAQMDILSTGREVTLPSPETCRKVRQQYEKDFYPGHYEWPALLRGLDRVSPDYAD